MKLELAYKQVKSKDQNTKNKSKKRLKLKMKLFKLACEQVESWTEFRVRI